MDGGWISRRCYKIHTDTMRYTTIRGDTSKYTPYEAIHDNFKMHTDTRRYTTTSKCTPIELRTPSAHNGATLVYIAIEKISKFALAGSMHGYSEDNMISALNEIKARVRPVHGEIEIILYAWIRTRRIGAKACATT